MFQVFCIDDSNRPNEIPLNRWIAKEQVYTVVKVTKLNAQGGIIGLNLKELNIDDLAPYEFFDSSRFAVILPSFSLGVEGIKENLEFA